jgi:hypothetical protein
MMMRQAASRLAEAGESRNALKFAALGAVALVVASGLLWLRYGSEVFTAALQAAWTCF